MDLKKCLQAQQRALESEVFPENWVRIERLKRLRAMVVKYATQFSLALSEDFGVRSAEETELAEVMQTLTEIDTLISNVRSWMKPRRVFTPMTFAFGSSRLVAQPRGVIGIVAPWNYPLVLSAVPLADALAAGNRAMVKLSEKTPRFASLFADVVAETFRPDEVSVVTGDVETARSFCELAFDLLIYTGGTEVARQVYQSAARNLTPVILELGGKSQCVIAPGADLRRAVQRILVGKLINAGQTCIAPDVIWIERSRLEAFVDLARELHQKLLPDFSKMTSVITPLHFKRLLALANEAQVKGARVVKLSSAEDNAETSQMVMRLAIDPAEACRIETDEIFGPLLLVRTYMEVETAINAIRTMPHKPLALYWFDTDKRRTRRVESTIACGGMTVNDTLLHFAQNRLPFGGVGESGIGAYHGKAGFDAMTHWVPVFEQGRFSFFHWLNPPYGRLLKWLMRWKNYSLWR